MRAILWKPEPDEHDYPAARDYLELVAPPSVAERVVAALRDAPTVPKKSKDLLRASRLDALEADNPHVAKDLRRIHDDVALSPVLLVRGDPRHAMPLIVADGYHRICAVHLVDENAEIQCRIVDLA